MVATILPFPIRPPVLGSAYIAAARHHGRPYLPEAYRAALAALLAPLAGLDDAAAAAELSAGLDGLPSGAPFTATGVARLRGMLAPSA